MKKGYDDVVYICSECAKQRLYLWPDLGSVHRAITGCTFCDAYGVCFDVEDLIFIVDKDDIEN